MFPRPQEAWGWPDPEKVHGSLVQVHSLGLLPFTTSAVNFRHFRVFFFFFFLLFFALFFLCVFMVLPTWVVGKWTPPPKKLNGSPSWHVHEGEVGHRSLAALEKSWKNLPSGPMWAHFFWVPKNQPTSWQRIFFFFQKKVHRCSSHIPCFKSSCFAASEKQFKFFRHPSHCRQAAVGCACSIWATKSATFEHFEFHHFRHGIRLIQAKIRLQRIHPLPISTTFLSLL